MANVSFHLVPPEVPAVWICNKHAAVGVVHIILRIILSVGLQWCEGLHHL